MNTRIVLATIVLLAVTVNLFGQVRTDKDVAYGPHERNVLDVYWKSEFKNAPIVFTIHGGGFRSGSKAYCSEEMRRLYLDKGCVVVSPNYRLKKPGTPVTIADCEIDCAMAVAYIQAHARKYGGDPKRIVSTGSSAGGYLSAQIAYRKAWDWPADAKHKPKRLNIVGWYGDSAFLPPHVMKNVDGEGPPGFMIYGEKEHPATPAKQGHDMQAIFKAKGIWNQMVFVKKARHVPGRQVLFNRRTRHKPVFDAFDQFLDMVCYSKGSPEGGDVIEVTRK